jgi:hypothetical protein
MGAPSTAHDPGAASAAALALPADLAEPYVDLGFARVHITPASLAARELRQERAAERPRRGIPLLAGASCIAVMIPLRIVPPCDELRDAVMADADVDALPHLDLILDAEDPRLTIARLGLPPLADDDPED